MDRIQIAVVGSGFGSQVHVPAWRSDPRCRVIAICARDLSHAQAAAARLEIPHATNDWRELLKLDLQAISIATPPTVQSEIAAAALKAGIPVFAEKPLAADLSSARQLADSSRTSALSNMVDFEFLSVPAWQRALDLLRDGAIGALQHIAVNWHVETYANRMGLINWKTTAEAGGGTLMSFTSHVLYYLEQFAGPIATLRASLIKRGNDTRTGDTQNIIPLQFASGATAGIHINTCAPLGTGHRVECYGEEGVLLLENPTPDYIRGFRLSLGTRKDALSTVDVAEIPAQPADGRIAAVSVLTRKFADWVMGGSPARPDFTDGLRVQELIDAARRADQQAGWVEIL